MIQTAGIYLLFILVMHVRYVSSGEAMSSHHDSFRIFINPVSCALLKHSIATSIQNGLHKDLFSVSRKPSCSFSYSNLFTSGDFNWDTGNFSRLTSRSSCSIMLIKITSTSIATKPLREASCKLRLSLAFLLYIFYCLL